MDLMFLRRRGDLDLVMAQLGTLFATKGNVDNYFECANKFTTKRGEELLCDMRLGHAGPHESGDYEWWDGGPEVLKWLTGSSKVNWIRAGEWFRNERAERVRQLVADHIRSAPEREAAALREWARST